MRKCVAIDSSGNAAMCFDTLKGAGSFMDVKPKSVFDAIAKKKTLAGHKWMYQEEYDALTDKEREQLAWAKPTRKIRKLTKEEKVQQTRRRVMRLSYAKTQLASSFSCFAKYHLEWLNQLKDVWLESMNMGIRPELLADYYKDKRDKEVALLASLLIAHGERCYGRVQKFRKMLGRHPWRWFEKRGFANANHVGKIDKVRVFRFFNEWWQECFKYGSFSSIENCVKAYCLHGFTLAEAINRISCVDVQKISWWRITHVLLILSDAEGVGQSLWDIRREDVQIHVTASMFAFMLTWLPEARRLGKPNDCVRLFGMDSIDFLYCYLAYEELKRLRPKECSRYATYYQTVYESRSKVKENVWRKKQPKISFTPEIEDDGLDG